MGKIYASDFDPILLPGETALLITETKSLNIQCVAVDALPEYQKDFGALTAATWARDNEDSNLELADFELSQLRMRVIDDMRMEFNNLGSTKKWRTSKTNFYLGQFPQTDGDEWLKEYMFKASEFFVYEQDTPRFDFYSIRALATSRVLFSGWKFRVRSINQPGKITILVSGWNK
ncbi:MAG: hypothetical protein PHU70_02055 [Dehalococcoidia bacterium]|nr:hypothetical protein [Dehalococcoidia bacterium]